MLHPATLLLPLLLVTACEAHDGPDTVDLDASPARIPRVRQLKSTVGDGLDKQVVRRIVRAHINEFRYCYNLALERDPDASGRVTIAFEVDAAGDVVSVDLRNATLGDAEAEECLATALGRWKFPKPSAAGNTKISYPFEFLSE